MRRVVVTGVGVVTALGAGAQPFWTAAIEGRSGIGILRGFLGSSLPSRLGAEVDDRMLDGLLPDRRSARLMTRDDHLAFAGGGLAVEDSKLDIGACDSDRVGLFVASGKDGGRPDRLEEAALASRRPDGSGDVDLFMRVAPTTVHPLFYAEGFPASALFYLSKAWGIRGSNVYYSGTAEAGITAIVRAYRAIQRGEADMALAGASDAAVSPRRLAAWQGMGAMSESNELGGGALRPYDRDRDGTVLGEGSAFLMLEEERSARMRGARIYAEIAGVGRTNDCAGVTPDPTGRSLADAIDLALNEARAPQGSPCYVATHGSGTSKGDASEACALRSVSDRWRGEVWASSVKPVTGHLMAAAGALNVVTAALAIHHGTTPPTMNLRSVDPACEMRWVRDEPLRLTPEVAVGVGRGLWGQSVAVALRPSSP